MYEGIENIYPLLDNGRLKEALTQLQAIAVQNAPWELRNRIESTLTAYGYMLQYAAEGMDDPNRHHFYLQTLRTAYELTDATNIALLSISKSTTYFDRIRTLAQLPAKSYAEIQMQLETFTEDISTVPLLYHDAKRREEETEKIQRIHESALTELFDKTWATPFWTEAEAKEAEALLQSMLVGANDLAVMVSAATLSFLRTFDARKLNFLLEAYRHEDAQVNQRAIVGCVIALHQYEKRLAIYPELTARLSLLCSEEAFRQNLFTIQMQFLITRETDKIDKKMREEIIPDMLRNAKPLNNPNIRFDDHEEAEDLNPEWMDDSVISERIQEMGEWQMAGADIYMGSFAQLKHYPFFHQIHHWFYPFDLNLPALASFQKDFGDGKHTPFELVIKSDHFCNSDKYSFCMAIQEMPKSIREMTIGQLEAQAQMTEEQQQEKLLEFLQQTKEAKGISRQYIQDLYRFFKLWKRHRKEEEDIFQWKFNLWDNTWLGNALQKETTLKELADYLLQKEYLSEAYQLYQKLTDSHSTVAEVYQKAGFICQKQHNYEEAIRLYRHADVLSPDNVWTNRHLAQCYKLEGNMEVALEYYRKVEAVQPDNLNVALQIGQCLARMEKHTEALSYFYKVEYLEKSPDNARRAIAWCSFVSGKHEEAMKYYRLLLESPAPKVQDWLNAGHVHFVDKRTSEAIAHYRKAQENEKDHSAFIERFYKDKEVLLAQGLEEEDIRIMLDLII